MFLKVFGRGSVIDCGGANLSARHFTQIDVRPIAKMFRLWQKCRPMKVVRGPMPHKWGAFAAGHVRNVLLTA
jgi:hypothetical protein